MNTCLICDDHALVREALAGTVRLGWPGVSVTEVGDFPSAWAAAADTPDLILADLMMPGAGPLAGIDGIIRAAPETPVLVITGTEDDSLMLGLLDRGVAGFAPKTASGSIIEAAIRLILAGRRYLPMRLANIVASQIDANVVTPVHDPAATIADRLTERQQQVMRLMAEGRSNKDIARALDLAPSTVKTHMAQIFLCLGVINRTEAAIKVRSLTS